MIAVKHKIKKIVKFCFQTLSNYKKPVPIYPKINSNGLKIHLGPGEVNMQGWINIDARKMDHTHLTVNSFNLKEFTDGEVDQIYLCHVLEHFSFMEAKKLISVFHKKLKPNGILRISVPCFDSIIKIYKDTNNNLNYVKYALMGGQDYKYNFHYSVYNKKILKDLYENSGFFEIEEWDTIEDFGVNLNDWSNSKFKTKKGKVNISLNLKGRKN